MAFAAVTRHLRTMKSIWSFFKSDPIEKRDQPVSDPEGTLAALWSGIAPGSFAVSGAEALRVPAVASAVRVISEAAACLDVYVMERKEDGTEGRDNNHIILDLLRGDANSWTSGFELIRDLVADALCRDWGGIAWVNRVGEEVREIIRFQPSTVSVTYDPRTGEPSYTLDGGKVSSKDIIHVRGAFDRCPLNLASDAIGAAREMEKHAGNLFKNGARPGGVIENEKNIGEEGAKKMLLAWRKAMEGAANSGKTAVLWDNAKWKAMTLNSVDSQFLELRKFQISEIARAFRVPPSMLFELDRATWSNSEQMGREFLTYCLEPWLKALEAALGRALFSKEDRKRFRIMFDRDDLTRASLTERATAISSFVSAKAITRNEARSWIDLGPVPGGDDFENPHINPETPAIGHNGGPKLDDPEPETPTNDTEDK